MTKSQITTIILQDAEIKRLQARVRVLESGYLGMCRQNDRLRNKIKTLEKNDAGDLSNVNT